MMVRIKTHSKKKRVKIRIEKEDIWNLDITLAYIIKASLIKYKKHSLGCPHVNNEDVPLELKTEDFYCDKKWLWILDEMIWVFDILSQCPTSSIEDVSQCPTSSIEDERIANALLLFAKYYRNLWV